MSKPAGMLQGDQFSIDEWRAAKPSDMNLPVGLPSGVEEALERLRAACGLAGLPCVAMVVTRDAINTVSDLGSNPANVPATVMLARATVSGDPDHIMQVSMAQIGQMRV